MEEWNAVPEAVSTQLDELVSEMEELFPESEQLPEKTEEPTPQVVISEFSLVNGQYSPNTSGEKLLQVFFQGLQLDTSYSPENEKYMVSGTNAVESTNTEDDGTTYLDKSSGEVSGEYDPATGQFSGTFVYNQSYDIMVPDILHWVGSLFNMTGEFTGTASPKDTTVTLIFHGINHTETGTTVEYTLNVPFEVLGVLPFTQLEP